MKTRLLLSLVALVLLGAGSARAQFGCPYGMGLSYQWQRSYFLTPRFNSYQLNYNRMNYGVNPALTMQRNMLMSQVQFRNTSVMRGPSVSYRANNLSMGPRVQMTPRVGLGGGVTMGPRINLANNLRMNSRATLTAGPSVTMSRNFTMARNVVLAPGPTMYNPRASLTVTRPTINTMMFDVKAKDSLVVNVTYSCGRCHPNKPMGPMRGSHPPMGRMPGPGLALTASPGPTAFRRPPLAPAAMPALRAPARLPMVALPRVAMPSGPLVALRPMPAMPTPMMPMTTMPRDARSRLPEPEMAPGLVPAPNAALRNGEPAPMVPSRQVSGTPTEPDIARMAPVPLPELPSLMRLTPTAAEGSMALRTVGRVAEVNEVLRDAPPLPPLPGLAWGAPSRAAEPDGDEEATPPEGSPSSAIVRDAPPLPALPTGGTESTPAGGPLVLRK